MGLHRNPILFNKKRKELIQLSYTLENFIDFCDDYQIAEEGVKETFQKMKAALIRFFANAVISLNKKAQSMKDSKFKYGILKLCKWATDCLNKSKTLSENDTELAHQLQQDAKELSETMERIKVDETTAQSQTKTTQSGGQSQQSEGETIRTKHATKSKSNKRKSNDDHLFDEMDQMLDESKKK